MSIHNTHKDMVGGDPVLPTDIRLSFVVATTGRPTLARTLRSISNQSQYKLKTDECIIVSGTQDWMGTIEPPTPEELTIRLHFLREPGNDWGNLERATGITRASGTHIVYCDDDDALRPGAVAVIKRALARRPDRPHMFRMVDMNGALLWGSPELKPGNVGTPMFVFPNWPERIGHWEPNLYEADFHFMVSTLDKYPDGERSLVWDTGVIVGCRSHGDWATGTTS